MKDTPKKFRPISILGSHGISLIRSYISTLYELMIDPHNDQLPVGVVAQLVEHCSGIAEVWVRVPYRPIFRFCFSSGAKLRRSSTQKLKLKFNHNKLYILTKDHCYHGKQKHITRIHKIFVLFIKFHVVRQATRNKDVKKLNKRERNKIKYLNNLFLTK